MFAIVVFIFGLVIGSFLNSVIYRLAKRGSIARERSKCPSCRAQLRWFELIPLLSFTFQLGHCRHCRKPISWQYPLVELAVATLFTLAYLAIKPVQSLEYVTLVRDWVYVGILVVIFVYDLRRKLILDRITVPAMLVALGFTLASPGLGSLWLHLIAGLVAGGFFLIQFVISRGRWIGGGDIRLGLLMGLMLGWPGVLVALFIAYVLGALWAVSLVVTGKQSWSGEIAFGTFLSVGTVATLLYGGEIISWYLSLL